MYLNIVGNNLIFGEKVIGYSTTPSWEIRQDGLVQYTMVQLPSTYKENKHPYNTPLKISPVHSLIVSVLDPGPGFSRPPAEVKVELFYQDRSIGAVRFYTSGDIELRPGYSGYSISADYSMSSELPFQRRQREYVLTYIDPSGNTYEFKEGLVQYIFTFKLVGKEVVVPSTVDSCKDLSQQRELACNYPSNYIKSVKPFSPNAQFCASTSTAWYDTCIEYVKTIRQSRVVSSPVPTPTPVPVVTPTPAPTPVVETPTPIIPVPPPPTTVAPEVPFTPPATGPYCHDSDGINFDIKGEVNYRFINPANQRVFDRKMQDECSLRDGLGASAGVVMNRCWGENCYLSEATCKDAQVLGSSVFRECTHGCEDGVCRRAPVPIPLTDSCIDSDNGNTYLKGSVLRGIKGTFPSIEFIEFHTDSCGAGDLLGKVVEYGCNPDQTLKREVKDCKYGCEAGACKKSCVDDDGGKVRNVKGTVTYDDGFKTQTFVDECFFPPPQKHFYQPPMIVEYYCWGQGYGGESSPCANCRDGVCLG